ncbi:MAG TPA: aromatic-ring-hydroxylating dioxygenase subunit beta [Burkholderiales bacterium]|nr:aromatic-ring-hydroxylating dioxygenase subunit beta [Burkholderiales bacterium]
MSGPELLTAVCEFVYREAALLDEKRWEEWLGLYAEAAVFWMPSWASESQTIDDPEHELNLLYLKGRSHLEDRVFRLRTGDSFASVPMDRTTHLVSNVLVTGVNAGLVHARASWLVHASGLRGDLTRSGSYEYTLERGAGSLKILRKKIIMINDRLIGPVDFYHV